MIYLNPKNDIISIIQKKGFTGLNDKDFWKLTTSMRIKRLEIILKQI
jgi:hypothetical protein